MAAISIPNPVLQVDFFLRLGEIRKRYLQEALSATIDGLDLRELDAELAKFVPPNFLKALAKKGLRGELLFPAPCLFKANPCLLGYYRLLLGFSQKEFYSSGFGVSGFKSMECRGMLSKKNEACLPTLCESLIRSACFLLQGIGFEKISKHLLYDLSLLTVGPMLRGGSNVRKGIDGINQVFEAIKDIVKQKIVRLDKNCIVVENAAGRLVYIEFAADPDIVIREEINSGAFRNAIAIEVKGGKDFSNIHNRVGEAEKSHQKARADGYVECWTVVNVDNIDVSTAAKESPTTNRFFKLSAIIAGEGPEYQAFFNGIIGTVGI